MAKSRLHKPPSKRPRSITLAELKRTVVVPGRSLLLTEAEGRRVNKPVKVDQVSSVWFVVTGFEPGRRTFFLWPKSASSEGFSTNFQERIAGPRFAEFTWIDKPPSPKRASPKKPSPRKPSPKRAPIRDVSGPFRSPEERRKAGYDFAALLAMQGYLEARIRGIARQAAMEGSENYAMGIIEYLDTEEYRRLRDDQLQEASARRAEAKKASARKPSPKKASPRKPPMVILPDVSFGDNRRTGHRPHRHRVLAERVVGNTRFQVYENWPRTAWWIGASSVDGHWRDSDGLKTTVRHKADEWIAAVNSGQVRVVGSVNKAASPRKPSKPTSPKKASPPRRAVSRRPSPKRPSPAKLKLLITDKAAFDKLAAIEGTAWADKQRKGGIKLDNGFKLNLRAYETKVEQGLGATNIPLMDLDPAAGVIAGGEGRLYVVMPNGEVMLDGESADVRVRFKASKFMYVI